MSERLENLKLHFLPASRSWTEGEKALLAYAEEMELRAQKAEKELAWLQEAYSSYLGYTYFIQAGEDGPIKIGWSKDPEARLARLQTGNPNKLRILFLAPSGPDLERDLHKTFREYRLVGEWFRPDPTLLRLVDFVLKKREL